MHFCFFYCISEEMTEKESHKQRLTLMKCIDGSFTSDYLHPNLGVSGYLTILNYSSWHLWFYGFLLIYIGQLLVLPWFLWVNQPSAELPVRSPYDRIAWNASGLLKHLWVIPPHPTPRSFNATTPQPCHIYETWHCDLWTLKVWPDFTT